MRKWCYAGAVAVGILLLRPASAHADVIPAPADGLLGGGLTPDGRIWPSPAPNESALIGLLGGLGGLPPADQVPRAGGMPAGGTAVDPTVVDPDDAQPVGGTRSFSDSGRPIAGIDKDFR